MFQQFTQQQYLRFRCFKTSSLDNELKETIYKHYPTLNDNSFVIFEEESFRTKSPIFLGYLETELLDVSNSEYFPNFCKLNKNETTERLLQSRQYYISNVVLDTQLNNLQSLEFIFNVIRCGLGNDAIDVTLWREYESSIYPLLLKTSNFETNLIRTFANTFIE